VPRGAPRLDDRNDSHQRIGDRSPRERSLLMDLDDVTLELRTREQVRVALAEFPLLDSDQQRVKAARRLIRRAGN
jgi:hypothetical protein